MCLSISRGGLAQVQAAEREQAKHAGSIVLPHILFFPGGCSTKFISWEPMVPGTMNTGLW